MTVAGIEYLVCDINEVRETQSAHPWLASLLSPAEVKRSDRLRHASDRIAYRCAHLVLRLVAARRLGADVRSAGDLEFTRCCRSCGGPHGKPQVTDAEISLSRSGTMVLVGSAPPSSPIGVDIEGLPSEVFPGFDDYVLAPGERTSNCTNSDRRRLELWVAKEAALKTTGHGLSVEPNKLEVVRTEVVRTSEETSAIDGSGAWASSIRAPDYPEIDGLNLASVPCRPSHAAALSCVDQLPVTPLTLSDLLIE
ncbi:4'-phosphopantetheinyl transferase family protein [Brevibacterium aurantiacum]|uniref:4'-phosphopantetheinyl transferase family protein n=1 Tax=Brevibacterium aurantiacum TaxID=273384 RepID=UPI001868E232|nr:4'-phosphopantetheinyl transferase superfamily protein [Brevibacterium aurantiacum]